LGESEDKMKKIMICFLVVMLLVAFSVPASARGRGGFLPGLIIGGAAIGLYHAFAPRYYAPPPVYVTPAPTYVPPPPPYYRGDYDRAYEVEMERLRRQEYAERQRLEQERARQDARRDFFGGYQR
jgi:hypothetical protein